MEMRPLPFLLIRGEAAPQDGTRGDRLRRQLFLRSGSTIFLKLGAVSRAINKCGENG